MTLTFELPQIVSIVITIIGGIIGLAKYMLAQISKDIKRIEEQGRAEANGWKQVERDLMELRAELPLQYVRREDYVRGQSVIEAKLDALYNKLEVAQLRAAGKEV